MKKRYKVISILLAVIVVVVVAVLLLQGDKEREIVLTDFKYEEEYQFGALNWGAALDEVEDFLNSSLETDPGRTPAPEGYAFYNLADATYLLELPV